jgi:hypothetical protein
VYQRGSEARFTDQFRARRNVDRRRQIDAAEHHPGIYRSGSQGDPDLSTGMEADAGGADQGLERTLP